MSYLTDLFNPSFFLFLGVLFLTTGLFTMYYESKFREQNHKFNTMLSLVSSLAEEVNSVKFGLNQVIMRSGAQSVAFQPNLDNLNKVKTVNTLIEVSDDNEDEEDFESGDDDDSESIDSDDDSESSNSIINLNADDEDDGIRIQESVNTIKILKMDKEGDLEELEEEDLEEEELDDDSLEAEDLLSVSSEDLPAESSLDILQHSAQAKDVVLKEHVESIDFSNINTIDILDEIKTINILDEIKTINILDETKSVVTTDNNDAIEYKKMSVQRLRTLVTERNLVQDSSKLKKPELLKLLGEE